MPKGVLLGGSSFRSKPAIRPWEREPIYETRIPRSFINSYSNVALYCSIRGACKSNGIALAAMPCTDANTALLNGVKPRPKLPPAGLIPRGRPKLCRVGTDWLKELVAIASRIQIGRAHV